MDERRRELGQWQREADRPHPRESPAAPFHCPCCRYYTLDERPPGSFAICRRCGWEDDDVQFADPHFRGGANDDSLLEHRARRGALDDDTSPRWSPVLTEPARVVSVAACIARERSAAGLVSNSWTWRCASCGEGVRFGVADLARHARTPPESGIHGALNDVQYPTGFTEGRLDFQCPGCSLVVGVLFTREEVSMAHHEHHLVEVVELRRRT